MSEQNKLKEKIMSILPNKNLEEIEQAIENIIEISEGDSDISHIIKWLEEKRKNCNIQAEEIGINELDKWKVDPKTGIVKSN